MENIRHKLQVTVLQQEPKTLKYKENPLTCICSMYAYIEKYIHIFEEHGIVEIIKVYLLTST